METFRVQAPEEHPPKLYKGPTVTRCYKIQYVLYGHTNLPCDSNTKNFNS